MKWLGIIDFNEDGRHPTTGKVYYSENESVKITNSNAANLAYICFYSGKDATELKEEKLLYPRFYQIGTGEWVWGQGEDTTQLVWVR